MSYKKKAHDQLKGNATRYKGRFQRLAKIISSKFIKLENIIISSNWIISNWIVVNIYSDNTLPPIIMEVENGFPPILVSFQLGDFPLPWLWEKGYHLGCTPAQDSSHHQDCYVFRIGDPNLNLHLPLESWEGVVPTQGIIKLGSTK